MTIASPWLLTVRLIGTICLVGVMALYKKTKHIPRYVHRKIPKSVPREPQESDAYPAIESMTSGFFNQDWEIICETEDPDIALAQLRDENSPVSLDNLVRELKQFCEIYGKSDEELAAAFERVFAPEVHFYHYKKRSTREGIGKAIEILSERGSDGAR